MRAMLDTVILLGLAGALLAPLGYALATLRGMKARRFYPIFRFHVPRTRQLPFAG